MLELWFREFVDAPVRAGDEDEIVGIVGPGNAAQTSTSAGK